MTLIIAEAGVNHNGNVDNAHRLIESAAIAGANAVKFQTFKTEDLVTRNAKQADYQKRNLGGETSQFAMLKALELPFDAHLELAEHCKRRNIEFMSTAFDEKSLSLLVNELDIRKLKIGSGEITNAPFILSHAEHQLEVILSTGMSTLQEIESALSVLAFGYLQTGEKPGVDAFNEAYQSIEGQEMLQKSVTILHCTTEYPAPFNSINLNAISTMKSHFGLNVGYSDHSSGIEVPIAAVALGATVIEKHFTLDQNMPGPDHKASLEPQQLKEMTSAIRNIEVSMGCGTKKPQEIELKNRKVARKHLVAIDDIKQGDQFTQYNLGSLRAGSGPSPFRYWELLENTAERDYRKGEIIRD